jgi:hypothetical protein
LRFPAAIRRARPRLARAGPKAGGGLWLAYRTARPVLWRRPADPAVLIRQACSSYKQPRRCVFDFNPRRTPDGQLEQLPSWRTRLLAALREWPERAAARCSCGHRGRLLDEVATADHPHPARPSSIPRHTHGGTPRRPPGTQPPPVARSPTRNRPGKQPIPHATICRHAEHGPAWSGPAPRQAGASGSPAALPGRFYGGARPTRLPLLYGTWRSSYK